MAERGVEAAILEAEEEPGGTFRARVSLEAGGAERVLELCRLSRRPVKVRIVEKGEFIMLELLDAKGRGFASCPIHKSHIVKGCLDCQSLMAPAGGDHREDAQG